MTLFCVLITLSPLSMYRYVYFGLFALFGWVGLRYATMGLSFFTSLGRDVRLQIQLWSECQSDGIDGAYSTVAWICTSLHISRLLDTVD